MLTHGKTYFNQSDDQLLINLMLSTEASWWNILNLKIYTTLGYIVSQVQED